MSLRKSIDGFLTKTGLKEDRGVLITCIALSLFFWILVKLSKNYTTSKEVRFSYSLPTDKAFSAYPTQSYEVDIQGTGWDLIYEYFSGNQVRLNYDLSNPENLVFNQMRLRNDIRKEFSSQDISLASFNYDGFQIQLEERTEKKVPIDLVVSLSFAPQYHLRDSLLLLPDSVLLSGPQSFVDTIYNWPTELLKLDQLKQSVDREVSLIKPPPETQISLQSIKVAVAVEQYTEKILEVGVEIVNTEDSLRVFPDKIELTCVVGLSKYNDLTADSFLLTADFAKAPISKIKNTIPLQLAYKPSFVESVFYRPKSVSFFIIEEQDENEKKKD